MAETLTRVAHALQPLSVEELAEAVAILRGERGVDERFRFVQIALKEPAKAAVLAAEAKGVGGEIEREARAVLIDRSERVTIEAVVSLSRGGVTSWESVTEGQPPFTFDEMLGCEKVVREHPEFREAMRRRGITDMELVWVDPWTAGAYDDETDHAHRRLARGLVWVRDGADDDNGYAHPVENVILTFDLNDGKILRLQDFGVVHVPMEEGNFGPEDVGPLRTDLKPLE
ncbi:MAG: primary-amine oxidase, partial [Thermomicrobiales bacterium]|nr:primary-amine oxidase [Thermomicrobiales bacterium]